MVASHPPLLLSEDERLHHQSHKRLAADDRAMTQWRIDYLGDVQVEKDL
jgi:hypothetical protein